MSQVRESKTNGLTKAESVIICAADDVRNDFKESSMAGIDPFRHDHRSPASFINQGVVSNGISQERLQRFPDILTVRKSSRRKDDKDEKPTFPELDWVNVLTQEWHRGAPGRLMLSEVL